MTVRIPTALALPCLWVACALSQAPPPDESKGAGGDGGSEPEPPTWLTTAAYPLPSDDYDLSSNKATSGPSGAICSSGLSSGIEEVDACLTALCCEPFNLCVASDECQPCLNNADAPGCDTQPYLEDFEACWDTHCPTSVCGHPDISLSQGADPMIACNRCASTHCCAELAPCVANGSPESEQACNTCLSDPAIDSDTPVAPTEGDCFDLGPDVYDGAIAFRECIAIQCAPECGLD